MLFTLKKFITAWLMPPGVFVMLLMILAIFHYRRRRKAVAAAFFVPAMLLWLFSASVVSDRLIAPLENGFKIPSQPNGDVILLLGGGLRDFAPDLTGSGAPNDPMLARIVTAVRLQRMLGLPIVVSGGGNVEGHSEAIVAKRFMVDLGVPSDKILLEDKSLDTAENATLSKKILIREGFRKPLLVTSASHMRRSVEAFRKVGVAVTPVPCGFVTAKGRPTLWRDWLPSSGALGGTAAALHEYLGMLFYALPGTGKL